MLVIRNFTYPSLPALPFATRLQRPDWAQLQGAFDILGNSDARDVQDAAPWSNASVLAARNAKVSANLYESGADLCPTFQINDRFAVFRVIRADVQMPRQFVAPQFFLARGGASIQSDMPQPTSHRLEFSAFALA